MAKYRKVDPKIWNDRKFNSLSDDGKLAFLFLLTHPNMTSLGAMRGSLAGLADELGWGSEGFREAFGEALSKGMVECDEKANFIGIPKFLKYNQPESPNVVRAWAGAFELIPECDLKIHLLHRLKDFAEGLGEAFGEAFRKAFDHPYPNPEPEPEQEQEPEPEEEKARARDLTNGSDESSPARRIFEHWNGFDALTKHRALTDKIRQSINVRLKEGRSEADLCQAVARYAELCHQKRAPGYNGWSLSDLLSRNSGEWVDRMLDENYEGLAGKLTLSEKNRRAGMEWLAAHEKRDREKEELERRERGET